MVVGTYTSDGERLGVGSCWMGWRWQLAQADVVGMRADP